MAQLATFTQVEATKEMNDNTLQDMASNLVGKQVIMTTTQNSNGYIGGTVDYWETINGTVYLGIGGKLYDIADLDTVRTILTNGKEMVLQQILRQRIQNLGSDRYDE